jgi:uncharacterized protein YjbI with pentapeptide repeats
VVGGVGAVGLNRQTATLAVKPLTYEDQLFQLLRDGNVKEFNARKSANPTVRLADCDFRHLDVRGLDAVLILATAIFAPADLHGIDFSKATLAGASLNGARISGALFPAELAAQEIVLSLGHGTRLRYEK